MAGGYDGSRPLILIDVDGVLCPWFRCSPPHCKCHPHWIRRCLDMPGRLPATVVLNPRHGRILSRLAADTGAELAWGTMWRDDANMYIGPLIGLPRLPVAPVPFSGVHKAEGFVPWTNGRPFVWFDDEPDAAEVTARLAGSQPHLVIQVPARTGLELAHISKARTWLARLHRKTQDPAAREP